MKRNCFIIITLMMLLGISQVFGHPPDSLSLDYDQTSRILKVVVFHPTKDASKHIIDKVVVKLNNKEVVKQEFFSQMDREKHEVAYTIFDVKTGDEINVMASCNVYGKKKKTIQIDE